MDNSHTVLLKIATLYAERLMNDICLVVDGVEYPAHRLILCASSDVFQVSVKMSTLDNKKNLMLQMSERKMNDEIYMKIVGNADESSMERIAGKQSDSSGNASVRANI